MEPAEVDTAAAPAEVRENDPESLERYLLSFDWPGRDPAVEGVVVRGGLNLWREILRLVPRAEPGGTLLELGSPPFHTTLLVGKFRGYQVTTTAGVLDQRRSLTQRLRSAAFAETHSFECQCFDLERERFPFADDSFDVVLFCEVIEHLSENPVFALSEIHRVLRPGGRLVLSTPNAGRSANLLRLFFGGNVFDLYHLGSPLRGSRHSREFTLAELRGLIAGCGFAIEHAGGRDLSRDIQYTRRTRLFEPLFRALTRLVPVEHAEHLFLRARKAGAFRWHFPAELFDAGHLRWYRDVRRDEVTVGENDVPQTSGLWGPLALVAGVAARRIEAGGASVHLVARATVDAVEIELAPSSTAAGLAATVVLESDAATALGNASASFAPGQGGKMRLSLPSPVPAGAMIRVDLQATGDVFVHRVRLGAAAQAG